MKRQEIIEKEVPGQILAYHEIRSGVVFGKGKQRFGILTAWEVYENCKCFYIEGI